MKMQSFLYNEKERRLLYKRAVVLTILLLAQILIITMFSSQPSGKSSEISRSVMNKMEWVPDSIPRETIPGDSRISLHQIVRKLAHFYNFFVVGFLLMGIHITLKESSKKAVLLLGLGCLLAIFDEAHQYFVPGRSAEIGDVLIDITGVLFGMSFIKVFLEIIFAKRWKNVRQEEQKNR
ncbi:MAG: VanZ family protein [Clostridia bacterium]|nr:VanZ family protein [Clostridia bacterium]